VTIAMSLFSVLLLSCFAPIGLDVSPTLHRRTVASMGLGAVLMAVNQDWWLLAFWVVLCVNALRLPWPAMRMSRIEPAVMFYGVYMVGTQAMTMESTYWLLNGLVLLGMIGAGLKFFGDHSCAQNQSNHAEALMVVSVAACAGLAWWLSPWWLLFALPGLTVIKFEIKHGVPVGQAFLWLFHLGLLALLFTWPWVGLGVSLVYVAGLCRVAYYLRCHRTSVDGGRVRMWWTLLYAGLWMRPNGWREFFLGHGWQSWAAWADQFAQVEERHGVPNTEFFLHPHSEYVHVLFEHGVVGLVCFLCWMGSLAWQALEVGPLGQAVLFPAVAIASVALTSFPWTPPASVALATSQTVFGNMGLVIVTLVIAILVGGVL
jgi:hypothetical protein